VRSLEERKHKEAYITAVQASEDSETLPDQHLPSTVPLPQVNLHLSQYGTPTELVDDTEDSQWWDDDVRGLDVSGYENEANEYIEMATRAVKEREIMETQLNDFANWDGMWLGYELGAEEERCQRYCDGRSTSA
jgi:hypothetical protein